MSIMTRDLFHMEIWRRDYDYSVMQDGIIPQHGVELEVTVVAQQPEQTYTYTIELNPCLDIPYTVEAVDIMAHTEEGSFRFHYPYEELLVSLRPRIEQ